MIAALLGLSGPIKMAILGAIAMTVVASAIGWLRWDAIQDERTRAAAAGNAAVIEVLKERNKIEREIQNEPDSGLRDLLGIPR